MSVFVVCKSLHLPKTEGDTAGRGIPALESSNCLTNSSILSLLLSLSFVLIALINSSSIASKPAFGVEGLLCKLNDGSFKD